MTKIKIYYFKFYNPQEDRLEISKRAATIDFIKEHKFEIIKDSMLEVSSDDLELSGLCKEKEAK